MVKPEASPKTLRQWAAIIVPEAAGGIAFTGILVAGILAIVYVVMPLNDRASDLVLGHRAPEAASSPAPTDR